MERDAHWPTGEAGDVFVVPSPTCVLIYNKECRMLCLRFGATFVTGVTFCTLCVVQRKHLLRLLGGSG